MSGFQFDTFFTQSGNGYILDIEFIRGGVKQSVATLAALEDYVTDAGANAKSAQVIEKSMLVYVEGGTDAASNNAEGWWYFDSAAAGGEAVTENWGWVRLIPDDQNSHLIIREEHSDQLTTTFGTTTTVQIDGGAGIDPPQFTQAAAEEVMNLEIKLDYDGMTNYGIPLWDASAIDDQGDDDDSNDVAVPKNFKFIDSGLSYNTSTGYTFAGISTNSDDVIINGNLNVLGTTTSAVTVTTANLSTQDTFIRIGDPASFTQLADDADNQEEYALAVDCGLVVNTGYYDDDASDTEADPAYSTHKVLMWDATFDEWILRDGTPTGGAADAAGRFDSAETDANIVNGTTIFLRNFYADAKEVQFGLNSVFSFAHHDADTSNNPAIVTGGDVEFMKTRYVPTIESLRTWTPFFDPTTDQDNHYNDFGWADDIASDANVANQMADTYVRYARVVKAKVDLEGGDVQSAGSGFKKIQVYHGGIFGSEIIPIVRCYALKSGTEGADNSAVYEEIIVNVTQKYGDNYVEITFNEGYLTVSDGVAGNILHVRMIG